MRVFGFGGGEVRHTI